MEPETKEDDQDKEGPKVKPGHRLLIKSAILMPTAKENEVTVVQIESEGYKGKTVSCITNYNSSLVLKASFSLTKSIVILIALALGHVLY